MSHISVVLELVPVALALVAIAVCSRRLFSDRRKANKRTLIMAIIASSLLVVAQLSWWKLFAIDNKLQDTVWVNAVWTAFNSLVMLTFIRMASGGDTARCNRRESGCPLVDMDTGDRIRLRPQCTGCPIGRGEFSA